MPALLLLLLALSSIGSVLDTVLVYGHFAGGVCLSGGGCSAVLASQWATVAGVPVSLFGLSYFLVLNAVFYHALVRPERRPDQFRFAVWMTFPAIAVAMIFIAIQAFVLQQFCLLCLSSHLVVFMLAILLGIMSWRQKITWLKWPKISLDFVMPLLVWAMLPFLVGHGIHLLLLKPVQVAKNEVNAGVRIAGAWVPVTQLDQKNQLQFQKMLEDRFRLQREAVDALLIEREALARKMPVRDLVGRKMESLPPISAAAVADFFAKNQAQFTRFPKEVSEQQIRNYLREEQRRLVYQNWMAELWAKYAVEDRLPRPTQILIRPNPYQVHRRGNPLASVKIVEFADPECGYCAMANRELERVLARYPDDFSVEFRFFPLEMHRHARQAAKAAICAGKQGQFFPYLDRLFETQTHLEIGDLRQNANAFSLNLAAFETCLTSADTQQILNADIAEGQRIGVTATPTLIINGHYYLGFPGLPELLRLLKEAHQ